MDKEQDVIELLDAIIWGRRIVEIRNILGEDEVYVIRPLTLEEKNMGNYIYESFKKNAIKDGLLTREQLKIQAVNNHLWQPRYDNDLESLRAVLQTTTQERVVEEKENMLDSQGRRKRMKPTTKLKRLDAKLTQLKRAIWQLENDYTNHIELPSAEYAAECERGSYFLHCVTLSFPDMDPVWPTFRDLKEETDTVRVANLMRAYYNESIANDATIRRIARSGFWRCKWMGAKKNRGVLTLFNREMFDLTLDQFRLMYWSQIYDSAYESIESPSDDIINDDKLFDRWLEEQHNKREQERKKSAFDKKVAKFNKQANANEVGFSVIGEYSRDCTCGIKEEAEARGYDKRGHIHAPNCPYGVFLYYNKQAKDKKVEEVQSANPEQVRKLLGREQKRLSQMGEEGMAEQHLRGDATRAELGLNTQYYGPGEFTKRKQGRAKPH